MKVQITENNIVLLAFEQNEAHVAVAVLRGIHRSTGLEWVRQAALFVEKETAPKQLTFTLHTRICEKCFCEIDIRSDNAIHYTGDQDKWVHLECKTLKPNRPE